MDKYTKQCNSCLSIRTRINDYFCIKNTGRCEHCLANDLNYKVTESYKRSRLKSVDNSVKFV